MPVSGAKPKPPSPSFHRSEAASGPRQQTGIRLAGLQTVSPEDGRTAKVPRHTTEEQRAMRCEKKQIKMPIGDMPRIAHGLPVPVRRVQDGQVAGRDRKTGILRPIDAAASK